MTKQATAAEIRTHYRELGQEVRISKDGHVTYRPEDIGGQWLEGRWVSEYRIDDAGVVLA
jgi:hypothetical protein